MPRTLSLPDHRAQLVALLITERDDVFFGGDYFPGRESAPLFGGRSRRRGGMITRAAALDFLPAACFDGLFVMAYFLLLSALRLR